MSGDKLKRFLLTNQDVKKTAYPPILIKPKQPLEAKLDDPHRLLICKLQNRHQKLISSALSSANPLSSYVDDSGVPVFVNCTGIQYTKKAFWLEKIHFLFSRGKLFGQFSVPGKEKAETYSVQSVICAPKFSQNADCRGDFHICIECTLHSLKPFRFKITSHECVRHRFNNHLFLLDVQSNINSNNIVTSSLFTTFNDEYKVKLDIKGFCVLKEGDAEIGTYLLIGTKKSGNPFTTADSLSFSLISLQTIGFEYAALGKSYTNVRPLGVPENAIEDNIGNVTESHSRSLDLSVQGPLFSETPSIENSREVNDIVENEVISYDRTDTLDQNRQCRQLQKPIRGTRTTETFNLSKLASAVTKSIQVDNTEDVNSSYSENADNNQTSDISSVPSVHSITEFSDLTTMRENINHTMSLSNTRPETKQPAITIEITPTISRADVDVCITCIRQCGFEIRQYPIPPAITMVIEHVGTNPGTAFVVPETSQPIKLLEFIQLLVTNLSRVESHCTTSGGNVDCAGPSCSRSGEAPPTLVHAASQPTELVQPGEGVYTQHNREQYQIQTENPLSRLHLNNLSAVLPAFSNNDLYDPDPEQFVPDKLGDLIDTFCTGTLQAQDTSAQYGRAPEVLNGFSSIQNVSAQPNQNVISRVSASNIQNINNAPPIPRTVAQTDSISRVPVIPSRILSISDENCVRRISSTMSIPSTSAQSDPPSRIPDIPSRGLSTSDENRVRKTNNTMPIPSTSGQSGPTFRMTDILSRKLSTSDENCVRKVNNATSIPSTSAQSDPPSRMPDFQSRGLSTSDENYVRKTNNTIPIPSTSAQSEPPSRTPNFSSRGLSTSDGNCVRRINSTIPIPSTSAQSDSMFRTPDFTSRDLSTSDENCVRKINSTMRTPSASAQSGPMLRTPDFTSRDLSTSDENCVRRINSTMPIPSASAQSGPMSRTPNFPSRGLSTSGQKHFPNTLNQPDVHNEAANTRQFDNLHTKRQPVVLSGGPSTPYTTIGQTPTEQSGSRESATNPSSLIPVFLPSQMTSIVSLCVDEKFNNLQYIAKASEEKMDKVINTLANMIPSAIPSMVSEEVSKQVSRTVGSYFNTNPRDVPISASAGNEERYERYDTSSLTPKNRIDRPEILGKTISSNNKRENSLPYTPPHRALPRQNLPSVNLSLSDTLEDMIRIERKKNNESAALSVSSLPYITIQQQRLHLRKQQQEEQDRLHHQQKRQKQEEQYQQQQLQHYLQQRQQQQEERERQNEQKQWQHNQHLQQQQQLEEEAYANRLKQFERFEEFEKWSENKQLSTNNSTCGNVQLPVPTYGRHNDLKRISSRYTPSIPAGPAAPSVALNPATASTIIPTPLSLKDDKWGIINYFFNTTQSNANDREVLKKSSRLVQHLERLCSNFRAYNAAITAIYCKDFIIITFLKLEECGWLYECCKQQLTVSTLADHSSTTRLCLVRQDTLFDDLTVRKECNCSNVRLFVYHNILDVFASYKGTTRLNKHDEQGLLIMERENDSLFTVMFILVHVFAK